MCNAYNYADGNIIGWFGNNVTDLSEKLKNVSKVMVKWFNDNLMKVNPNKFQLIVFNRSSNTDPICLNNINIECRGYVKLLRVNFNVHITECSSKT